MNHDDLIAEARGKYKSLAGLVVVSPTLLARMADALAGSDAYIRHLESGSNDELIRVLKS